MLEMFQFTSKVNESYPVYYVLVGISILVECFIAYLCFTAAKYLWKLPEKNSLVIIFYTVATMEVICRFAEKIGWAITGCTYSMIAFWPGNIAMGLMLLLYLL